MLKFYNFDIVFSEIPDEVTLAINISACPNCCEGCHSPWLWKDEGNLLNQESLSALVETYLNEITCVCFMGGDNLPEEVDALASFIKSNYNIKTAWYSGKENLSEVIDARNFNYIKLGPYIKSLGPLKDKTTNQRLYSVSPEGEFQDITSRFWKK